MFNYKWNIDYENRDGVHLTKQEDGVCVNPAYSAAAGLTEQGYTVLSMSVPVMVYAEVRHQEYDYVQRIWPAVKDELEQYFTGISDLGMGASLTYGADKPFLQTHVLFAAIRHITECGHTLYTYCLLRGLGYGVAVAFMLAPYIKTTPLNSLSNMSLISCGSHCFFGFDKEWFTGDVIERMGEDFTLRERLAEGKGYGGARKLAKASFNNSPQVLREGGFNLLDVEGITKALGMEEFA